MSNAQGALGARAWDSYGAALSSLSGRLSLQAVVRAFNENFLALAMVFALSLTVVFLLKKPKGGKELAAAAH